MFDYLNTYIQAQKAALDSIPLHQVEVLIQKYNEILAAGRQVFVCGNGGSASNASHFITDLSKGASDHLPRRFRAASLNENVSWITALGNDYSYEDVYARQLMNFAQPGDLFMALSVSGSSPNVVKAAEWALANGVYTVALVGGKGGKLADVADFCIRINDAHFGRAEDAQMAICHLICYAFIEGKITPLAPTD